MAALEVIALDTSVPQLMAPQAGDTYVMPRDVSITGNTTLGNASTDLVTVNGYMGVGGAGSTGIGVYVRNTALTATSQVGVQSQITATSAATTGVYGLYVANSTEAAAFTVGNAYGVRVSNLSLGAGSSATNQHGLHIADLTSATNNYGITSLVSSGANKWNIYASGTAANYFAGNVLVGATTSSVVARLAVVGGVGAACASFEDSDLFNRPVRFTNTSGGTSFDIKVGIGATALETNGAQPILLSANDTERLRIGTAEAVFNDPGNDYDFRVESDTNTHALFVDAGNSRVGINNSAPTHALTVSDSASTPVAFARTSNTVGQATYIALQANNASNNAVTYASAGSIIDVNTAGAHSGSFTINTVLSAAITERVRVKSTGQVRFVPLAADPAGAEAGDVYYNSGTNKLRLYDGTSWVDLN